MPESEGLGGPALQTMTAERVNQQRDYSGSITPSQAENEGPRGHQHDNSVLDKISQFNTLSMQSRQLERKTADDALRRVMVGREEAEAKMRQYRDETRSLRKQVEEGRERERRVGERLEAVMENYGRAKETYAHTQELWEKEIRRARKETFKSQSIIVKLQELLKSVRSTLKATEDSLDAEKQRTKLREDEAFTARYQLVATQDELAKALQRAKQAEQERDAYKTLVKEEEVARIAAEGKLPLPTHNDGEDDEFASPQKASTSRVSLGNTPFITQSSSVNDAEIEALQGMLSCERQRADRAIQEIEFLKAECELKVCPAAKELKATAGVLENYDGYT